MSQCHVQEVKGGSERWRTQGSPAGHTPADRALDTGSGEKAAAGSPARPCPAGVSGPTLDRDGDSESYREEGRGWAGEV